MSANAETFQTESASVINQLEKAFKQRLEAHATQFADSAMNAIISSRVEKAVKSCKAQVDMSLKTNERLMRENDDLIRTVRLYDEEIKHIDERLKRYEERYGQLDEIWKNKRDA